MDERRNSSGCLPEQNNCTAQQVGSQRWSPAFLFQYLLLRKSLPHRSSLRLLTLCLAGALRPIKPIKAGEVIWSFRFLASTFTPFPIDDGPCRICELHSFDALVQGNPSAARTVTRYVSKVGTLAGANIAPWRRVRFTATWSATTSRLMSCRSLHSFTLSEHRCPSTRGQSAPADSKCLPKRQC